MLASKSRCRNQETARRCDLFVESAHAGVQELDAHADCIAPAVDVHLAEVAFGVDRGQPVNAVDWAGSDPPIDVVDEGVRSNGWIQAQNFDGFFVEHLG